MAVKEPTFRDVVRRALRETIDRETPLSVGDPLADKVARRLREDLAAAGYSIHRSGECVHPRARRDSFGRPMTPEEEAMLLGSGTVEPPIGTPEPPRTIVERPEFQE
jgi:hypothetical protein